jgi:hypothetical protein
MKMTMQEKRDEFEHAKSNAAGWLSSIEEMLEQLSLAGIGQSHRLDGPDENEARQAINQSVLSVMVRDGWREPGLATAEDGAEDYEILLSTGGPALRIWGRLSQYAEPETAELQMQDWGTPWTRYPAPEATLLKFAQCFYFGG